MAIIKHLKRLGDTVRGAVSGRVCSFDKDGNVISTAKYVADMPGHPATVDTGKVWTATGSGAASWQNVPDELPIFSAEENDKYLGVNSSGNLEWSIPEGSFTVTTPTISIKEGENEIPHGVSGRLISFGSGLYYLCVRINFASALESSTTVKVNITGVPANTTGSYHYEAIMWDGTKTIIYQTINEADLQMTLPSGSQYLMINTMIFSI